MVIYVFCEFIIFRGFEVEDGLCTFLGIQCDAKRRKAQRHVGAVDGMVMGLMNGIMAMDRILIGLPSGYD